MLKLPLVLHSMIDAETFTAFARFDTYKRNRMLRSPLIFLAIMAVFSAVCFILQNRFPGGALLGTVLAVVGVGLPLFYVLRFEYSIRKQCKRMMLDVAREAYAVELRETEVKVSAGKEVLRIPYDSLLEADRNGDCIYLYANRAKAFLIPAGSVQEGEEPADPDEIWNFLVEKLKITNVIS